MVLFQQIGKDVSADFSPKFSISSLLFSLLTSIEERKDTDLTMSIL